jgi:hypothetical protein
MNDKEAHRLVASWCKSRADKLAASVRAARRAYPTGPLHELTNQYADLLEKQREEMTRAAFALNIKADRL